MTGLYLTLEQNASFAPVAQNAPFEFTRCPVAGRSGG